MVFSSQTPTLPSVPLSGGLSCGAHPQRVSCPSASMKPEDGFSMQCRVTGCPKSDSILGRSTKQTCLCVSFTDSGMRSQQRALRALQRLTMSCRFAVFGVQQNLVLSHSLLQCYGLTLISV